MALCPRKFIIGHLTRVKSPLPLDVWVQGTIEQKVGNEVLIISDPSGKAKITKCSSADGVIDQNSFRIGAYCCIIGMLVSTKGVPEIQASKFVDLSNQEYMKAAWNTEVSESYLILNKIAEPSCIDTGDGHRLYYN